MNRQDWRAAVAAAALSKGARATLLAHAEDGADRYHDDGANLHGCTQGNLARITGQPSRSVKGHVRTARERGYLWEHSEGYNTRQAMYHYTAPGQEIECDDCQQQQNRTPSKGTDLGRKGTEKQTPSQGSRKGTDRTPSERKSDPLYKSAATRAVMGEAVMSESVTCAREEGVQIDADPVSDVPSIDRGSSEVLHPPSCDPVHLVGVCSIAGCDRTAHVCFGRDGIAFCFDHRMHVWDSAEQIAALVEMEVAA